MKKPRIADSGAATEKSAASPADIPGMERRNSENRGTAFGHQRRLAPILAALIALTGCTQPRTAPDASSLSRRLRRIEIQRLQSVARPGRPSR
ncbi:MAG: hypothetical protein V3T70_01380, partial [Phycisphaerae bacterium]